MQNIWYYKDILYSIKTFQIVYGHFLCPFMMHTHN